MLSDYTLRGLGNDEKFGIILDSHSGWPHISGDRASAQRTLQWNLGIAEEFRRREGSYLEETDESLVSAYE